MFSLIKIMDFNGTVLKSYQVEKSVNNFDNIVLMRFNITEDIVRNRSFININTRDPSTGLTYTNNYYFVRPADRVSLDPKLKVTALGNKLTIRAENLATYVWIRSKN